MSRIRLAFPLSTETRAALLLCLFLILVPGFGSARGEELTVTDSLGRSVSLKLPIRKIVALNSDALEALRILKVEDRIVGVYSQIDRNPDFWGSLSHLPRVGHWRAPDYEAISELEPDLILAYSRTPGPELEQMMAAQGFPVLRLDFYMIDSLEREILTLGRVMGREQEAERFRAWHHRLIELFQTRTARLGKRPLVYIESYSDYQTAGPGTGGDQLCALAGGRNIAAEMAIPFSRVTPEWVLSQNPEVILKAASSSNGYGLENASSLNKRRDAIMARPAWNHIPAVASGRVWVMDSSIWTGPAGIIGVASMVSWFHPETSPEVDPRALHREYIETFQGLPFKGFYVSDPVRAPEK